MRTASGEWGSMWPVVLAAAIGISGTTIFTFSSGVVMPAITTQFGWTHAQFSLAFVLQMTFGLVAVPLVGRLVDRFGPRRIALIGLVPAALGLVLLGQAGGSPWEWWSLCVLQSAAQSMVAPAVWITAIAGRFEASRGLAIAVVLAGMGGGAFFWPLLAAAVLDAYGWRAVFPALALGWVLLAMPMVLLFFFGAHDGPAARPPDKAGTIGRPGPYFSGAFLRLLVAGGLFSCGYTGIVVNLVPLLRDKGLDIGWAAGVAGLVGLFSIVGRLTTGYLLDRYPAPAVGTSVFALLIPAGVLLGYGHPAFAVLAFAVALVGLASGAELDIVTFMTARLFGLRQFASCYSMLIAFISLSASSGPLLAGWLFDRTGSYNSFLLLVGPMAALGAVLIASLPRGAAPDEGRDASPSYLTQIERGGR